MRSFVKMKLSRYGEITLSFTDIGKSFLFHEFLASQICFLKLFAKKKNSREIFQIYTSLTKASVPIMLSERIIN